MSTPCEQYGFKVGDVFEVKERNNPLHAPRTVIPESVILKSVIPGSIVQLVEDDNTEAPLFKILSGDYVHPHLVCSDLRATNSVYCSLYALEKLEISTVKFTTLRRNKTKWVKQAQKEGISLTDWIVKTLNKELDNA